MTRRLCITWATKKKLRRDEFIAPPEGMTACSPRRLFSPVCKLWDTCVAMWRTELAGLPEIANPLSSEMSCVAWPRTSQAAAQPRSQALSPHYRLLSWPGLPWICRYSRASLVENITWNAGYYFKSHHALQLWDLLSCAAVLPIKPSMGYSFSGPQIVLSNMTIIYNL